MKVCDLGNDGGKVLLVKQGGHLSALGTKCSHYGAPLASGALGNGRIRCPWHGACFSLKTGDIEDFPGLDSIPCYKVEVTSNGGVKVRAKKSDLAANKRMKSMCSRDMNNNTTFVIVGAGGAGQCCAETLRQEGFTGRLVMVSEECVLPYDRIKLSKQLDATPEKLQLRNEGFYKEYGIELMLGKKAIELDTDKKVLTLDDNSCLNYDSLFLATGSRARKLNIPGIDLKCVFTVRSIADAGAIHKALNAQSNVVIYGSSFIGMEAATYCIGKVNSVTVVGRSPPFKETLGTELSDRISQMFLEKGVKLVIEKTVECFRGDDNGRVKEVVLSDGSTLQADVVILGLGTTFSTDYLNQSTVKLNSNGSIPVNEYLETNVNSVFAGGDIACAPVLANGGQEATIGHWQLAHYHGRVAALNMIATMCQKTSLASVPFFWTVLFGTSFRYAGSGGYANTLVVGDVDKLKCAVYYIDGDGLVKAVTTVGSDPVAAQFAELLSSGRQLTKQQLETNPNDWWIQA
ncbi:hypothetical protein AAG570_009243 [Ranatra chinensis]|uniref:Rieske domain-containing protein n=1 Tax=Ranatra chinensis TaxID=642074 RepID=A0ABD0ZGG6_9HEMI